MKANQVINRLELLADLKAKKGAMRFFKEGQKGLAQDDIFIGVKMPQIRALVKELKPLALDTCVEVLASPIHEARLFALLMMVELYKKRDPQVKEAVYQAYMANRQYINNWDLVDAACYKIIGPQLTQSSRQPLYQLIESDNLWDRRIALVSCLHFIRLNDFEDMLKLVDQVIQDEEDLIHKAAGWMLKEMGKRDEAALQNFLLTPATAPRYKKMPRTLLRTAIEKLSTKIRQDYLKGRI